MYFQSPGKTPQRFSSRKTLGRVNRRLIALEIGVHCDCPTLRDLPENGDDGAESER